MNNIVKERPLISIPAVRRWARKNGIDIGTRGRVASRVVAEYREAKASNPNTRSK